MYLPLTLLALLTPSEPSVLGATPVLSPVLPQGAVPQGSAMLAAAEEPPKKPQPRPRPKPEPKPEPKPQPRPDPCPACGMG